MSPPSPRRHHNNGESNKGWEAAVITTGESPSPGRNTVMVEGTGQCQSSYHVNTSSSSPQNKMSSPSSSQVVKNNKGSHHQQNKWHRSCLLGHGNTHVMSSDNFSFFHLPSVSPHHCHHIIISHQYILTRIENNHQYTVGHQGITSHHHHHHQHTSSRHHYYHHRSWVIIVTGITTHHRSAYHRHHQSRNHQEQVSSPTQYHACHHVTGHQQQRSVWECALKGRGQGTEWKVGDVGNVTGRESALHCQTPGWRGTAPRW